MLQAFREAHGLGKVLGKLQMHAIGGEAHLREHFERLRPQAREDGGELTVERDFLEGALGKFPGLSGKR